MTAQIGMNVSVSGASGSAAQLGRVGDAADRSGERWRKMGQLAKAGGLAVAAGGAAAAAAAFKLAQGAAEDDKAATQLATALRNNADATRGQVAATEDWITAQGKAYGVADDELRPALARLAVATGSVTKAQGATRLAMNISAGSGKSLTVVTTALARAQTGSLTGLGKLNVRTKDAEGKTRSLKDITADLADMYRGQAAKAADTVAGRFGRLKLELDETGESIGYKLLPAGEALADWITGSAIPKTERLWKVYQLNGIDGVVTRVEKWTDTQGKLTPILDEAQLAGESLWRIVKDLAPAFLDAAESLPPFLSPLQSVGDVLDVVADAVEAIPDPLKSMGIQAGIAALILPRLTAGVTAASGAFMVGTTRALGFGAALRSTGTAAQTQAFSQLGGAAKQAAGIGGMLALSSGLNEVSQEGATTTGVLKGVAGGAGIGAMFGPIGALIGAGAGGGLIALKGAMSDTREEAEAARLELLRTEGLEDAKRDADSLRVALNGVVRSYGNTSRAAVQASFTGGDGKLEADIARLRDLGVSMDTIVSATLGNAGAQQKVNAALKGGLSDLQGAAQQATKAYEDAVAARGQMTNAAGKPIPDALADYANSYTEEAKARDAANAAVAEATRLQDNFATRIGETARTLNAHQQQIRDYAHDLGVTVEQYKAFPKSVRTDFEENGLRQTADGAMRLLKQYEGLQNYDRIRAVISAPGVDLTVRQIRKLGETYDLTPKQVTTLVRVTGAEKLRASAKQARDDLESVGRAKPDLQPFVRGLESALGEGRRTASRGATDLVDLLAGGTRKARADLSGMAPSIREGLGPARATATSGAAAIGNALEAGIIDGFASTEARLAYQAAAAIRGAIGAARAEADIHSPSRKMHYLGLMLAKGAEGGIRKGSAGLTHAGVDLIRDLVAGIGREKRNAERVLDAVGNEVEKTTNRVQRLQQLRASYVSDFRGFSSSVFTAQAPTLEDGSQGPQTVDGLLSFAASQADQAKQVEAAVQRLTGAGGLGLSGDLIKQLRAQGAAGIDQILTLASGSREQIALLNSYNAQANGAYTATGLGLFAQQGGAADLAQAQRDDRTAKTLAAAVREALQGIKLEGATVRVSGSDILIAIAAENRKKGKQQ